MSQKLGDFESRRMRKWRKDIPNYHRNEILSSELHAVSYLILLADSYCKIYVCSAVVRVRIPLADSLFYIFSHILLPVCHNISFAHCHPGRIYLPSPSNTSASLSFQQSSHNCLVGHQYTALPWSSKEYGNMPVSAVSSSSQIIHLVHSITRSNVLNLFSQDYSKYGATAPGSS